MDNEKLNIHVLIKAAVIIWLKFKYVVEIHNKRVSITQFVNYNTKDVCLILFNRDRCSTQTHSSSVFTFLFVLAGDVLERIGRDPGRY